MPPWKKIEARIENQMFFDAKNGLSSSEQGAPLISADERGSPVVISHGIEAASYMCSSPFWTKKKVRTQAAMMSHVKNGDLRLGFRSRMGSKTLVLR